MILEKECSNFLASKPQKVWQRLVNPSTASLNTQTLLLILIKTGSLNTRSVPTTTVLVGLCLTTVFILFNRLEPKGLLINVSWDLEIISGPHTLFRDPQRGANHNFEDHRAGALWRSVWKRGSAAVVFKLRLWEADVRPIWIFCTD